MNDLVAVNEVEAQGRCIAIRDYRGGRKLVTLFCKGTTGYDIYPQFVCNSDDIPEDIIRRTVSIKGHIQNFPIKTENGIVFRQRFVADSIQRSDTLTERKFGTKGAFFGNAFARVYLKGVITRITEEGDWFRIVVNVGNENKRIPVRVNMKKMSRQTSVKEGDTVCLVCMVATPQKIKDDKKINYEDILVYDLAIVKEAKSITPMLKGRGL